MVKKGSFEIGEEVFAKWPGSRIYYPGKIVGHDDDHEIYIVKFEDNPEAVEVLSRHVTSTQFARSWRSSSASPSRSPARGKRTRSRSKSPSRAHRRRRSPARITSPRSSRRKTIPAKTPVKETNARQVNPDETATTEASPKIVETTDGQESTNDIKEEKSTVITKRVTRSVARLKDQDNQVEETTTPVEHEKKPMTSCPPPEASWRHQLEAVFSIVLMPLTMFALYFVCADKHQAFSFTKWPKIPDASVLFHWRLFIAVGCWFDIQFLMTLLPIGKIYVALGTGDGERLQYRLNGLFIMAVNIVLFGILTYSGYAYTLADLVDKNYLNIATSCFLVSFVAGIVVMIKAKVEEKAAVTPYCFLNGVQLNPKLLNVDFKMASVKSGMVLWNMLSFCFLLNQYNSTGRKELNLATLAVMIFQLVYTLHTFYHERLVIDSRDIKHEKYGFGFAFMSLATLPFFYSIQVLFLSKVAPTLTPAQWIATITFQVVGFYIFDKSNREKMKFRHDMKKAMKKEIKVVFTPDGKNLLADGWWGRLRHPNYLGDILVSIAWAIPAGCTHALPWVYPVMLVALLVFRARADEAYCAQKYGLSWNEYKDRVKYVIFPYIY